jgi:membrane-associated phospholipid phosphatase
MNIFKKLATIIACLLIVLSLVAQNQSPYHLSLKRELMYGGGALGSTLIGLTMHQSVNDVNLGAIQLPKVPAFDDMAPNVLNIKPSNTSDVLLFSSIALPNFFWLGKTIRKDVKEVGLLYVEAMLLNLGVTDIIKTATLRPRPYNYNQELSPATVLKRNDRSSFFSGHTSATATASFFCARVFADYYPDSPLKPYIWTAAALLPATTAYLRVRAGKHFPSDVVIGYLIGGSIGYLIPELHKRPLDKQKLNVSMGLGGMALSYRF